MAEPEFHVAFENLARYCRVCCTGKFDEKLFRNLVDQIRRDRSDSPSGKKYLIDLRGTHYVLDAFARFRLGEYSALQLGTARIAVIGNRGQTDKLSENTAFNRGLQILVTHVPDEAEAWVTGGA